MRIALVHDYLVQHGGAEKVLESFCALFPHAPIYTIVYDRAAMRETFADRRIITSRLQRVPLARTHHRIFPALMPMAVEEFDFSAYDIVLSDSSSFAKGIITRPETLHISYVHTPMRYAWDDCQKYTADFGFPKMVERIVPIIMNGIRLWDRVTADRVDHYIANSQFVARRIKKYYGKDATVINPPVDIERFFIAPPERVQPYYLMVGRIIAYKRHDIAIEAFNRLGLPLKIIGRGPELAALKRKAKSNIEFLGRVTDEEKARYYAECQAFIFPQEEDFGIVAIEAMASGRPLVAYRGGDIVEHMRDGVTGVFFDAQTPESLMDGVRRVQNLRCDPNAIAARARGFDREIFQRRIKDYVENAYDAHMRTRQGRCAR